MDSQKVGPDPVRTNSPETIQEFFDRTTDYWDTLYGGTTFIHRHMQDRKAIVLAEVEQISHGRPLTVLDMGCGTGVLTRSLLERGHRVAGVDCAGNMLARLRRCTSQCPGERFLGVIQASVCATPFQDGQFDLVLCVGVIQYQQNEDGILKEISRLTRTGGYCVLTVPNLLTVAHLTDPIYGMRLFNRLWTRVFLKSEPCAGAHGAFRVVGEHGGAEPCNKKYLQWEIVPALARHGLILRKEIGYGFGPLTLGGRELVPDRISIRLSKAVDSLARCRGMKWLSYLANRWIFVVQKV